MHILYESSPCLVVFKPAGILTQAPPGIDSLELRIKRFLAQREGIVAEVYLGVPHRLDRPVSGAMVFARDLPSTRRLARQFEHRKVRKIYWACVEGVVEPPEGVWHDHVRKVHGVPRAEIVPREHPDGRPAELHYRTLGHPKPPVDKGEKRECSWLEIELATGRYHQIRLQAAARGFPVLGDELYGSKLAFGPPQDDWRLRPIALHARELSFLHPTKRELITAMAELPREWAVLALDCMTR